MKFPTCFKRKREKYGKNITPTRRAGAEDIVGPGLLESMPMIFGESLSKRNQLRPFTRSARRRKTALFVPIELDEGRSTQIELNEGRSRSIEVNECRSRSIELDRVSSSSIEVNRGSSSSIEVNRVSSSSIQMSSNELDRAGKKKEPHALQCHVAAVNSCSFPSTQQKPTNMVRRPTLQFAALATPT